MLHPPAFAVLSVLSVLAPLSQWAHKRTSSPAGHPPRRNIQRGMSGGAFTTGTRSTKGTAWSRGCGGGLNLGRKVATGRRLGFFCWGFIGSVWLLPSGTGVSPSSP